MNHDHPETEAIADSNADLDMLGSAALVERLVESQRDVAELVAAQRDAIGAVVEAIVARLKRGGRLHYVGAGTSGRLAVLDAAEIPPTFGTDPDLVRAHIAGGAAALVSSVEGAEDDAREGEAAMRDVTAGDAVVGLSASGRARYVIAAVETARRRGAFTAAIVSVDASSLAAAAENAIVVRTGAEPVAGSTRMRAGTAQKIVLNVISTASMVLLGHVYENLMVDVRPTNEKLRARALRLVRRIAGVDPERAEALLAASDGSVKAAVVMSRRGCSLAEAHALLERSGGRLRDLV